MVTSTLCLRLISSNLQIRSLQIKKQNLFCLELRRVCDFCVAVCLHVLCSLCHTEYWLGGRWSHGSCLAMLTTFFFKFYFRFKFLFSYSHHLFTNRGRSVPLSTHTSSPLTPADNIFCLPAVSAATPIFLSLNNNRSLVSF